jgi:hypothetical protein
MTLSKLVESLIDFLGKFVNLLLMNTKLLRSLIILIGALMTLRWMRTFKLSV